MSKVVRHQRGFTLIESVIGIVILGFALSVLMMGVYTSSTTSHQATYQAQAAALGHSIMTDILSRQFDENSDPNGGQYRCGENDNNPCSTGLGKDGTDGLPSVSFNDVDDFIGCWGEPEACTVSSPSYNLNQLIDPDSAAEYKNFTVEINVAYVDADNSATTITQLKKIDITLYASSHAQYTFSAYRGNY